MSEKMTRISLPGKSAFHGMMDRDAQSAAHMIAMARSFAASLRAQADAIDAARDDDFQIDLVRGIHVQHPICVIQQTRDRSGELK